MPFANEHACRLHDPGDYTRFRRQEGIGDVDGKRLDAIIGFKQGGGSEVQSFRYPLSEEWTAAQARSHCGEHEGGFEAAKGEDMMMNLLQIEKEIREQELEALEAYRKGTAEAPVLFKPQGLMRGNEGGVMTFVASEETEDRLGDVIKADGWDLAAYQKNPVYLFGHDHRIPPIGIVPRVWTEGKQLLNLVKWDTEDEFAKAIKGKYERGFMRAQSVGFRPLEFHQRADGSKGIEFTKQELLEISAVSVPAHPAAVLKALGMGHFGIILPAPVEEVWAKDEEEQIIAAIRAVKFK